MTHTAEEGNVKRECSFFRNYGRCKFGNYCAYRHPLSREQKLDIEVNSLKSELNDVKQKLEILTAKIENLDKRDETVENVVGEEEKVDDTLAEKTDEVETDNPEKTLCDIIRENSGGQQSTTESGLVEKKCETCQSSFKEENKLKVHIAIHHTKVHPDYRDLYRLLRSDETFNYECLICDFQSNDWKTHLRDTHNYFDEETINTGRMRGGKEAEKHRKKYEQLMKMNQLHNQQMNNES